MTVDRNPPLPTGTMHTASPAVAGHAPLAFVLALATCFAPPGLRAQPAGAQAVHGTASVVQQGSRTIVTTANGAGTSHSVIDWQSFSVPGGTATQFVQPGATSTSINRVHGSDPSRIFGTLSSNGRLVLVNPAGIAVGAGAVVDTAGFTASTLRMSDADALAGRHVFGDGGAAGALSVDGRVLARSGDLVLLAPDIHVGEGAVLKSDTGATLLAAGRRDGGSR
ncbi:filamentous hemagglutinin N-terminal domain-containing protein [Ramlibacter sp.]|uniref:two-partner secretion domain-containing protein n=1 Tax=Ramlibacter sp. TaxID=1917967 RepID=UPI003D101572